MNPNALIMETVFAVLAGPITGVALAYRQRSASLGPRSRRQALGSWWAVAWQLGAITLAFSVISAILAVALSASTAAITPVVPPYATLWVAALALGALGAFCASCFSDPLDAAGCAIAIAMAAAFGVLVLGPIVASAPTVAINAALAASPIVATASAANLDLLRSDVLYRLSPLAHMRFDYPTWQTAFVTHFALAAACLAAMAFSLTRQGRTIPAERIHV